MAIADNLKLHWEIATLGTIASAGGESKQFANVYHYRRTTTTVEASKSEIADEFDAAVVPVIVAALNARANISQITVRCVNDATDATYSKSVNHDGAIAGESLPSYVVGTIRLNTAVRGRSGRGRKHFGPLSEADTTGDIITGAALTRMQTLRDALDNPFTDATGNIFVPCVVSRHLSQLTANPTTVAANDVNACVLNTTVSTLRRRKVRTVT